MGQGELASIHNFDQEDGTAMTVQSEDQSDKMTKKHLLLGVLGVVATIAVVYAVVKKINNNPNK